MAQVREITGGDLRTRYGRWADYRFRAFISYAHADQQWAERIEARLNRFVMPIELTSIWTPFGPPPRRMKPVFRDRSQARSHHDIDALLTEALDDSASLIIVCSPAAAASVAVNKEVEHFIAKGRRDRIFPVIVSGEPNDPARDPFPPALHGALAEGGAADQSTTPLAADARAGKDGWPGAIYKLIAGMAGVDVGVVTRDDQRRERFDRLRRWLWAPAVFAALLIAAVSALSLQQRYEALRTQSLFLARSADQQIEAGAAHEGVLLALEALPTGRGVLLGRPSIEEAKRALDVGLARLTLQRILHSPETPENSVASAAFSPDGARIVTASDDGTAKVWDAGSGADLMTLAGHRGSVTSAAFSPDGARIVTASYDKTAKIWDAASGAALATLAGHESEVLSAAFSPDGARIVTASYDGTAKIWDAGSGAELMTLAGHQGLVTSAAFSPDGTRIVTASGDRTAKIWDAGSSAALTTLSGHENLVASAAFSPDGTRIVTASWDGTAKLWDAATGAELMTLARRHGSVNSAAFSPDGSRIVTASYDRTAKLWDAATGAELTTLGHGDRVTSAAFSPDGTRIVTASFDSTAKLWNAATRAELMTLVGHGSAVWSAAFSPDGARIVTASHDKTAKIWDVNDLPPVLSLRNAIAAACAAMKDIGLERASEANLLDNFLPVDAPSPCDRYGLLSREWWARARGGAESKSSLE